MGNMLMSLKNTITSILVFLDMASQSVKEYTKNINHTATTLPSFFSYILKTSSPPPCKSSSINVCHVQVSGLRCILNETQKVTVVEGSKNNNDSNVLVSNFEGLVLIRKRTAVTKILLIVPTYKFLFYCYRCNKDLSGKDIYIYRGEWSFCSVDCRIGGMKAELGIPKNVTSQHLPSSQKSTKLVSRVPFVVGDQ